MHVHKITIHHAPRCSPSSSPSPSSQPGGGGETLFYTIPFTSRAAPSARARRSPRRSAFASDLSSDTTRLTPRGPTTGQREVPPRRAHPSRATSGSNLVVGAQSCFDTSCMRASKTILKPSAIEHCDDDVKANERLFKPCFQTSSACGGTHPRPVATPAVTAAPPQPRTAWRRN